MKKLLWLMFLISSLTISAQQKDESDREAVKKIILQFIESINKQDTVMYKSLILTEGQIWRVRINGNAMNADLRNFAENIKSFDSHDVIREKPFDIDIKVHKGIAMAWVPYEFNMNGKMTHCGIDVFTLIETDTGWKIVNASYTVDKGGCEELKSRYPGN